MSSYKQITSLKLGDVISQVFLVDDVSSRLTKTGKPYAQFTLKDSSGKIAVKIWEFDPSEYPEFQKGIYVLLTLEVQDYKGSKSAVSKGIPMPVPTPDDLSPYEDDDDF